MSAPQFTPGPWQRSGVRVKLGGHDCLAVGPDGFSIAFLPIGNRPFEQAGAIADARLIAAAPELYEAVAAMIAWDDAEKAARPFDEDAGRAFYRRMDLCAEAFEKARDALAKAVQQ